MYPIVRKVVIDGVKAVVAQFQFAFMAYFAVTTTTSLEAWDNIIDKKVSSIWVFALPTFDGKPNRWKIGLMLSDDQIITMELYDTGTSKGTVFLARPITDKPDANHFRKLMDIRAMVTGRRMKSTVSFRDIILKIEAARLFKYQLHNGRGHRFWVHAVLTKIQPFVHEVSQGQSLMDKADELMRHSWLPGCEHTKSFGYADEPKNPLNIVSGNWYRVWLNGEEV
ncbi:hypothetical protein F4779DRAFT_86449 [Xylariaceae sp. FL0662B]|nr:hypothetical protein F4779DRAFT_86449 [Xylariaceae sp. FL0662B]